MELFQNSIKSNFALLFISFSGHEIRILLHLLLLAADGAQVGLVAAPADAPQLFDGLGRHRFGEAQATPGVRGRADLSDHRLPLHGCHATQHSTTNVVRMKQPSWQTHSWILVSNQGEDESTKISIAHDGAHRCGEMHWGSLTSALIFQIGQTGFACQIIKTHHVAYVLKLALEGLKIDMDTSAQETEPLTLRLPATGSVRGCVIKNCDGAPKSMGS